MDGVDEMWPKREVKEDSDYLRLQAWEIHQFVTNHTTNRDVPDQIPQCLCIISPYSWEA